MNKEKLPERKSFLHCRPVRALSAVVALLLTASTAAHAADVPDFMKVVAVNEGKPASSQDIAFNNIYALNDGMFSIYEQSLNNYKQNFRSRQNLIMALFSAKGGRFILYRAGQPPLEAESPPAVYRMAKAVGHCAMATYDLLAPYSADSAGDQSWVGELAAYRVRTQTAFDALNSADLKTEDRELLADTLKQVETFMDNCLKNHSFTYEELQSYARGVKPDLAKMIALSSSTQVGHWYKVLEQWKQMLGKDWDNTYAISSSIYVARQNNILFSLLVQFMGEKAINDRLLLLETEDFTATPEAMMDAFIRIVSDRALGMCFYKNYRLMDYELLGGGGRKAIEAEAEKHGQKAILPPSVPFNSHEWPWKINPASGTGPASMDEIQ